MMYRLISSSFSRSTRFSSTRLTLPSSATCAADGTPGRCRCSFTYLCRKEARPVSAQLLLYYIVSDGQKTRNDDDAEFCIATLDIQKNANSWWWCVLGQFRNTSQGVFLVKNVVGENAGQATPTVSATTNIQDEAKAFMCIINAWQSDKASTNPPSHSEHVISPRGTQTYSVP